MKSSNGSIPRRSNLSTQVTGTGAIILAAAEEFAAVRAAAPEAADGEENLWDLLLFIVHGAAPEVAERAAEILPPSSSLWRGLPPAEPAAAIRRRMKK